MNKPKQTPITNKRLKLWINALLSNKYTQCTGHFKLNNPNPQLKPSYCVNGLAIHILESLNLPVSWSSGIHDLSQIPSIKPYGSGIDLYSSALPQLFGIPSYIFEQLANLNNDNSNFQTLANILKPLLLTPKPKT